MNVNIFAAGFILGLFVAGFFVTMIFREVPYPRRRLRCKECLQPLGARHLGLCIYGPEDAVCDHLEIVE